MNLGLLLEQLVAFLTPRTCASVGIGLCAWAVESVTRRRGFDALRAALWMAVILVHLVPTLSAARVGRGPVPEVAPPPSVALWLGLWALGAVVFVSVLASNLGRAARQVAAADRAVPPRARLMLAAAARAVGLARVPDCRAVGADAGPCVIGIVRPTVLLPSHLMGAPRRELMHVLLHECAHVKRKDALRTLGCDVARALLWFQPFVHLAALRLATLREVGADALAVAALSPARSDGYRRTLLRHAARLLQPSAIAFGSASILVRLRALARRRVARPWLRSATMLLSTAALLFLAAPRAFEAPASGGCLRQRYAAFAAYTAEHGDLPGTLNDSIPLTETHK